MSKPLSVFLHLVALIVIVIGFLVWPSSEERAGEQVANQVERVYLINGLAATQDYCRDVGNPRNGGFGVFQQNGLWFRCFANSGSEHGPDGNFTVNHITVIVYENAIDAQSGGAGLAFIHRDVLRVPFAPFTSTAWDERTSPR